MKTLNFPAECKVKVECIDDRGEDVRRISLMAYNGGPMRTSFGVVAVDLMSLRIPAENMLAFLSAHDSRPFAIIGHGTARTDGRSLDAEGYTSGANESTSQFVKSAERGFPWQASIGVRDFDIQALKRGETEIVNGQQVEGPLGIVKNGELYEISILPFGADKTTSARLVAEWPAELEGDIMDETESPLVEAEKAVDEPVVEAEAPVVEAEKAEPVVETAPVIEAEKQPEPVMPSQEDILLAERKRIADIMAICDKYVQDVNVAKLNSIKASAISDGANADMVAAQILEAIRTARPKVANVAIGRKGDHMEQNFIEAALCLAAGLPEEKVAREYGDVTNDARKHRGFGLHAAIEAAANLDGVNLPSRSYGLSNEYIKAASTATSLPGILSNVMGKVLLDAYQRSTGVSMDICAHRGVSDFKGVSSYRLNDNGEFEEVGADGELKSASFSEQSYTNQAKTYGKYIRLTRQMLINDDLGAFSDLFRNLGRGAAQNLEKTVIAKLLSNPTISDKTAGARGKPVTTSAAFFSNSFANLLEGAAYALTITNGYAGWAEAWKKMRLQRDPYGEPIMVSPWACLIPPELETAALRLLESTILGSRGDEEAESIPTANIMKGKLRLFVSPHLSLSSITGYSADAYYVLADPSIIAGLQLCWLNNVRTPTVESVDVAGNVLASAWRGYMDFGVNTQDPRAMVKVTGEEAGS